MRRLLVFAALFFALSAHAEVTIDWVTVGDPGNVPDTEVMICCETDTGESYIGTTGLGAVDYVYRVSKYEVTNTQYASFLNAVAKSDPNGLYNINMRTGHGGILRSGSSGSFTYSVFSEKVDKPVIYVSLYDALRFANWLHNGQPTGEQGTTTTEDGAYTITSAGIAANSITRNAEATIFLTNDDEWYKAAYYDPISLSYFDYPTGTDTKTFCGAPTAEANYASCESYTPGFTEVGSYPGSASPYGTFDQGGNAEEWTETIAGSERVLRGGAFNAGSLAAGRPATDDPTWEEWYGFRVAMIPEPTTALLVACGLVGLGVRRRLH
jgi:hypothetical protein